MKIRIFFTCVVGFVLLSVGSAFAQFEKGDKLLNVGIGVNSYYSGGIPLSTSFEVGVTPEISVGVGFDYLSYRYFVAGNRYGFTTIYLAARGSYHFNELLNLNAKEVDLYGGLSLGYRNFSWRDNNTFTGLGNSYGSSVFLGIHVGCRYYFNDKIGAFGELGAGGSSNFRLGAAFKF